MIQVGGNGRDVAMRCERGSCQKLDFEHWIKKGRSPGHELNHESKNA